MAYTTLISPEELIPHLEDKEWAIVDCRFVLGDPDQGRREYRENHIKGSFYVDLEYDLSGKVTPGVTGRHPLPPSDELVGRISGWGISREMQVVAYDDNGGMYAARLWWLLRWLGHDSVAVLDGGWKAWQAGGYPTDNAVEPRVYREFVAEPRPELIADAEEVLNLTEDPGTLIIDSRAAERYRGENETIDPVAGHIPGAVNLPFGGNLNSEGRFLPPEELRVRFEERLGGIAPQQAVFYCGSGVSAAQNLLALAYSGLSEARLYPGSWSDWITHDDYPRATGTEPTPNSDAV